MIGADAIVKCLEAENVEMADPIEELVYFN